MSETECEGRDDAASRNSRLSFAQKLFYGSGHILNDLCASMWFTYYLVFLHSVLRFENVPSGNLILIGQVTDALATPFVGIESDRTITGFRGYGRRKTWHLIGTICVVFSYTFVFQDCITCQDADQWAKFIYYSPFVVIFQIGWAFTQVSHLALIPDIADCESDRVELNAIRNAGTVGSNIVVFVLTYVLLRFDEHGHAPDLSDVTAADAPEFRLLVYIVVGLGVTFSIVFHVGTRENLPDRSHLHEDGSVENSCRTSKAARKDRMTWRCWFKQPQLYQIGVLYMSTRLTINISQVYMPLYLTETQLLSKESIASVPLTIYVSGLCCSLVIKFVDRALGRKKTYALGAVLSIGACVNMHFLHLGIEMYAVAVLLGVGSNIMLITSLALTADLINKNTESGAFVFGAMSFVDKLSNGVAVVLIQKFHPCKACCKSCGYYFQNVMPFVPGVAAAVALLALLSLSRSKIGDRAAVTAATQHHKSDKEPLLNGAGNPQAEGFGSIQAPDSTATS